MLVVEGTGGHLMRDFYARVPVGAKVSRIKLNRCAIGTAKPAGQIHGLTLCEREAGVKTTGGLLRTEGRCKGAGGEECRQGLIVLSLSVRKYLPLSKLSAPADV